MIYVTEGLVITTEEGKIVIEKVPFGDLLITMINENKTVSIRLKKTDIEEFLDRVTKFIKEK